MKKSIIVFLSIIFFSTLFAVEVDVNEILKSKKVRFQNYKGKHRNPDKVNAIYQIGAGLGRGIDKPGQFDKATFHMKYSLIHAVSKEEKEKLSADIFVIMKKARVDHIKNVRRILAGYYQRKYNYTEKEAMTLAIFTTYYNAIYRKNIKYFEQNYKKIVIDNVTKNNVGIALNYKEWPGKTRIVIPLTEDSVRGTIEKIDPNLLADDKVRDVVKKKEDLDVRKDIVDIQKDNLEEDKKRLEEDKKNTKEEKKELEKEKKEIEEEKKDAKNIRDKDKREEKQEEIKKKEEEVKEKEEEIKEKEEDIKKQEEKLDKNEDQIKDQEKEIAKDEFIDKVKKGDEDAIEELEKREEEVAKKEEQLDKEIDEIKDAAKEENVFGDSIYYLRIREYLRNGHYNNDMYLIDAKSMEIVLKSKEPNIAGSRYDVFSKGVVVITRYENEFGTYNLTLLDIKTLDSIKKGKDNIFWRSFIEIRKGHIFAILKEGDRYYLGEFDEDLKLINKSNVQIHEDTFISFFGNKIYINNRKKEIVVLNRENLKMIKVITNNL